MGSLKVKDTEYKYKENYRHLKEQFIRVINDDGMTAQLIKELVVLKDTNTKNSEQVLLWA